jgi:hypothetical protein
MHRIVFATTLTALMGSVLTVGLDAQSLSQYRDFALGSTVARVAATTGVPLSAFRTVYEKPALLQDFEWRPSHYAASGTQTDTIDQITFTFYNDQLSRMVVVYDSSQTSGMTNGDMVAAFTPMYGPPATTGRVSEDPEFGLSVARWQNSSAAVALYRGTAAWRLVLTSPALHAAAATATAQALRIEERDAPARERAQRRQDEAAERARQEETRRTNKAAFQP